MTAKEQSQEILKNLKDGVYEKDEVIALTYLTAIAGESIFLLGPPGVAKSLIARRLKYAFKDGSSFEYLMNRFSTPDEVFGPISISRLKNEDKYVRLVSNYLPTATVVFLDEIWKASPSIQNALLTVLNEKIYRNGEKEIKVEMKALVSASNELPAENEGLEALWDRFLLRMVVESVRDEHHFIDLILSPSKYDINVNNELKITEDEYSQWSSGIDRIALSEEVLKAIQHIRKLIQHHNDKEDDKSNQIYISDRRWQKIVRLLKTSAYLNERETVDLFDCHLMNHCLWANLNQIRVVKEIIDKAVSSYLYPQQSMVLLHKSEISHFISEIYTEITTRENIKLERSDSGYIYIPGLELFIKQETFDSLNTNYSQINLFKEHDDEFLQENMTVSAKALFEQYSEYGGMLKTSIKMKKLEIHSNYQQIRSGQYEIEHSATKIEIHYHKSLDKVQLNRISDFKNSMISKLITTKKDAESLHATRLNYYNLFVNHINPDIQAYETLLDNINLIIHDLENDVVKLSKIKSPTAKEKKAMAFAKSQDISKEEYDEALKIFKISNENLKIIQQNPEIKEKYFKKMVNLGKLYQKFTEEENSTN